MSSIDTTTRREPAAAFISRVWHWIGDHRVDHVWSHEPQPAFLVEIATIVPGASRFLCGSILHGCTPLSQPERVLMPARKVIGIHVRASRNSRN